MDYSLHLYGEVRQHLRTALQECAAAGKRVAIYGRGEAAELAYLSLKESGLEPVAIFDRENGSEFLGMPVVPIAEHAQFEFDLIIVATLDRSGQQSAKCWRPACRKKSCSRCARSRSRSETHALHVREVARHQRQALRRLLIHGTD